MASLIEWNRLKQHWTTGRSGSWNMTPVSLIIIIFALIHPIITHGHHNRLDLTLHFTELPQPVVFAQKNQPLTLNCSATTAQGPVKVSWRKVSFDTNESEDISLSDTRRVTRPDGSLFIKKFLLHRKSKKGANNTNQQENRRSDEGRYFCIIRNPAGALISPSIRVIGIKPPAPKPQQISAPHVELGSNVRFSCQSNWSGSAPVSYEWLHDDQVLHENSSHRLKQLPNGVLQIVNVSHTDVGIYSCNTLFNGEAYPTKEWELKLMKTPNGKRLANEFLNPVAQVTRVSNESLTLECLTKHFSNHSVNWTRSPPQPLPHDGSVDQFGNLHLTDLTVDDSGKYVCSVVGNQTDKLSITHTVRVIERPFILNQPESLENPSSQTVRIDCSAGGTPPMVVNWFKDAQPISVSGRLSTKDNGQVLVISQTVAPDSGLYQCVVENEAGSVTAAVRLVISASDNRPQPPVVKEIVSPSPTTVRIEIESPVGSEEMQSHIQAYTIHYAAEGELELQYVSPNRSVLIENLLPFTNYSFYVRAYGKSASEPSPTYYVMTKEDVPSRALKIILTATSATSLNVSWLELPMELARGKVISYEIHYRKRGQTAYLVAEVADTSRSSYVLHDLQPNAKYEVRVLAATSAGFSKPSDGPIWAWTAIEMPPIESHVLNTNYSEAEETAVITSTISSSTPLSNPTPHVPAKHENRVVDISIAHLLIWIVAGSVISTALVCLCILVLNCRKTPIATPCVGDRNGNCAFVNGHLPSMYGDVAEGREMESFLEVNTMTNKSLQRQKHRQEGSLTVA